MKNRALMAVLLALTILAGAAPQAGAESIWDKRTRSHAFLYADNLAADVGDSLTVLITEESTFELAGDRELEKTTSSSGTLNFRSPVADVVIPPAHLDQNSSRTFEGSLDYNGTRLFADSVTVSVVDRLPNGNLVVAGRSYREIAGEEVVTVLTGIVKPEDISGANTVSSNRVAYLGVYYETDGPSDSYVDDGIFNRILNVIWPF